MRSLSPTSRCPPQAFIFTLAQRASLVLLSYRSQPRQPALRPAVPATSLLISSAKSAKTLPATISTSTQATSQEEPFEASSQRSLPATRTLTSAAWIAKLGLPANGHHNLRSPILSMNRRLPSPGRAACRPLATVLKFPHAPRTGWRSSALPSRLRSSLGP